MGEGGEQEGRKDRVGLGEGGLSGVKSIQASARCIQASPVLGPVMGPAAYCGLWNGPPPQGGWGPEAGRLGW